MTAFKRLALTHRLVGFNALLTESDRFDLVALFGYDYMALGWMARGTLGLVVPTDARIFSFESLLSAISQYSCIYLNVYLNGYSHKDRPPY